jgi:endonuclease YncB( thermonuclease family)
MLRPRFLSAALFIALCVLIAAALNKRNEEMIVGGARAIDGDSLVVLGREMRLKGLDAPEARQLCSLAGQSIPCGRQAMQALQRWLARGPVTCIGHETDRYGRLLVTCRVNGADIGADLVRNGAAVAGVANSSGPRITAAGCAMKSRRTKPHNCRKNHALDQHEPDMIPLYEMAFHPAEICNAPV